MRIERGAAVCFSSARHAPTMSFGLNACCGNVPVATPSQIEYAASLSFPPLSSAGSHLPSA
jgi:hypothetical protein